MGFCYCYANVSGASDVSVPAAGRQRSITLSSESSICVGQSDAECNPELCWLLWLPSRIRKVEMHYARKSYSCWVFWRATPAVAAHFVKARPGGMQRKPQQHFQARPGSRSAPVVSQAHFWFVLASARPNDGLCSCAEGL